MKKNDEAIYKNKAELFEALNLSSDLAAQCLDTAARLDELWESGTLDILGPKGFEEGSIGDALQAIKDAAVAHWRVARKGAVK